jgi:hypothetical protein
VRTTETSEKIDHHRRRFFGTVAMTIAAAQSAMIGSASSFPTLIV